MGIKQLSVTLDNTPGQFMLISEYLGNEGINIRAISVADTSDVSTVRFVTDDPQKTLNVLQSHGYTVRVKEVLAVEIPDHPGALQAILKPLKEASVNVLYLYTYLGRGASGQPIVIMGVDRTEDATIILQKNWITIFGDQLYAL